LLAAAEGSPIYSIWLGVLGEPALQLGDGHEPPATEPHDAHLVRDMHVPQIPR
jgi:hypothetical protein